MLIHRPEYEVTKQCLFHISATTISTDRFINVNVENSAGVTAFLYPDKGEHMTSGYKIQPNMILELRLIEQGMQTDFPVTFHARTEDGAVLDLEGEETFVATPSEKPTDAFIVKITQSRMFHSVFVYICSKIE